MSDSRDHRAVDEFEHRCRIGPRIGPRVGNSLQYFLPSLFPNCTELAFRRAVLEEVALQTLNRAFLLQRGQFFLRAVSLGIAYEVTGQAMCHAFEKIGPRSAS